MTSDNHRTDRTRLQAEEVARRRHLLVTVSLTVLGVLAYGLTVLLTAGKLPPMLATHFGPSGQPDDYMRTPVALAFQGVVVVFLPCALLVSFALAGWWKGEFARSLSATISGLCVGLATLFVLLTVAHVGVADASEVSLTWPTGVGSIGAGLASALLAMLVLPAPLPRPEPTPVAPVDIAPNYRVSWFGQARMGQAFIVVMAVAAAIVAVAAVVSNLWWMWLVVFLVALLVPALTNFSVIVDAKGVRWRSALGWPRGHVKLADITRVSVIETSPGDFGGYGVRLFPGRVGIITRSGHALRVVHGQRELVITVDDAEAAAGVLEGLRIRRGAAASV